MSDLKPCPKLGDVWRHRKGDHYTVLGITSEPDAEKTDKHPRTVFYQGPDGRRWTRTLASWMESLTLESAAPTPSMEPVAGQRDSVGSEPAGHFRRDAVGNWDQVDDDFKGSEGVMPLYASAPTTPDAASGADDYIDILGDCARDRMIEKMARAMSISTNGHDHYWSAYVKSATAAHQVVCDYLSEKRTGILDRATDSLAQALSVLRVITEQDPVELALDPQWSQRIAKAGIAALTAPSDERSDCSCQTCRPITITDMRMVLCAICGNKRCPHATDHRNTCTGSNEPGQKGSSYALTKPAETEKDKG